MGAAEYVKDLSEFVKKFNDIELNRRILKLEEEVLDLTRERRRLEDRVESLERTLKFSRELRFKSPFYWLEGDPIGYCAACWESKRLAVHVTAAWDPVNYNYEVCPTCKHKYIGRDI